jgi:uncharacterized repeat protein (TIGR02543 family)
LHVEEQLSSIGLSGNPVSQIPSGTNENKRYWAKWGQRMSLSFSGSRDNMEFSSSDLPLKLPLPNSIENSASNGYFFAGWYLDRDFTGNPIVYVTEAKNYTFYPKFESNPKITSLSIQNSNQLNIYARNTNLTIIGKCQCHPSRNNNYTSPLRYLRITLANIENNFEFIGNAEIINNTDFRVVVRIPNNAPIGKYYIKRIDFADYWGYQVVAYSFYNFSSFTREVEFNID